MIWQLVLSLSALFISVALLVSGNAFTTTLLSVRLTLSAVEGDQIGWVMVGFSIGFVIGILWVGKVVARVGHIRAFAVFGALLACTTLLYPFSGNLWAWGLLRGLSGFSMAGVLLVVESWFSLLASNKNRARIFSSYHFCFYLSAAAGQLMLNVGSPLDFKPFSLAAILLLLSLIPLLLTRLREPAAGDVTISESVAARLPAIVRHAPLGFVTAMTSGVLISGFYTLAPVYAARLGLNMAQISYFMAVAIFAVVVLAWPMARLSDRCDRRHLLNILCLVSASMAVLLVVFSQTSLLLNVILAASYLGLSASLYPLAVAITHDRMPVHEIVAASGALLLAYGLGGCVGPVFSAAMMEWLGSTGLFWAGAALLLALSLYGNWHIRRSKGVPVSEQERFVNALPETVGVIVELDPRNEVFVDVPKEQVFNTQVVEGEPAP